MKTTTNIHKAETITSTATRFDDKDGTNTAQATEMQVWAAAQERTKGKPESELRAAARRHGFNLKELADRMGVNYGVPVLGGQRAPALDSPAAGEGHGGAGRGPRPGHCLSPGRPDPG